MATKPPTRQWRLLSNLAGMAVSSSPDRPSNLRAVGISELGPSSDESGLLESLAAKKNTPQNLDMEVSTNGGIQKW